MKRYWPTGIIIAMLLGAVTAGLVLAQGDIEGNAENGARIFAENCAVCHGPDGKGRVGANLSDTFAGIDVDAFVLQTISGGVDGSPMPAWSQANGGPLTEQEVADVAAYVIGLSGGTEPIAPAPTLPPLPAVEPLPGIPGDPNLGRQIFHQNCVVCHGEQGQGRIGATLARAWPGIEPEAYVRSVVENGVSGSPMPAWGRAHGGPLTDEDITNVSAYVLTLAGPSAAPVEEVREGPISTAAGLIGVAVLVVALVVVGIVYYRRTPG